MECLCLMESLQLSPNIFIRLIRHHILFRKAQVISMIILSESYLKGPNEIRRNASTKIRACEHFQAVLQEEIVFRLFGISIVKNAVFINKMASFIYLISMVMLVVEIKNTFIFGSRVEKKFFRPLNSLRLCLYQTKYYSHIESSSDILCNLQFEVSFLPNLTI